MASEHVAFFQWVNMLKEHLVPYKHNFKKIRVGGGSDGGYVMADLPCDLCLSYGSNDEISFENGLFNRYGAKSVTFDHTISGITDCPDWITFVKEGIAPKKTSDCDTLEAHIKKYSSDHMVLKMDVEGAEWSSLGVVSEEALRKFEQIVIEFHIFGHGNEYPALSALAKNFHIIHMHANPNQLCPYVDIELPKVLEVTWVRKDFFDTHEVDTSITFPDPVLDPVYALKFNEMRWWKRPKTFAIELLRPAAP